MVDGDVRTMFVRSVPVEKRIAIRKAAGARLMTMGEYLVALHDLHMRLLGIAKTRDITVYALNEELQTLNLI